MYIYEYTRLTLGIFLDHSSCLFLETGSLTSETKTQLIQPGFHHPPCAEVTIVYHYVCLFTWVLGMELKSFCIHGKHFTD